MYNQISFHSFREREEKECGRRTPEYWEFARMMDGDPSKRVRDALEFYLRFSSDDSVNYKGFNFTFVAETESKL